MTSPRALKLACLISGGGRTMMNLCDCIDNGTLNASIDLVIASHPDISGIKLAEERGLSLRVVETNDNNSRDEMHDTIASMFKDAGIDLVCLCGYLRRLRIDKHLEGRVINIHPALLPEFGGKGMYGMRVHRAVLATGRKFSGCTVHFVDEHYDHGPVILQRTCPVRPDDDEDALAARVFEQECLAYPEVIRMIVSGRVKLEGGRVHIMPERDTF